VVISERPAYFDLLGRTRGTSARIVTRYEILRSIPRYADYQALYLDPGSLRLVPNTEVWRGESLQFRTNWIGCAGPDPDLSLPVIAFFGDSTTMCLTTEAGGDSWPLYAGVSGYTVVNAGIEGLSMERVADRFEDLRGEIEIACAVVYTGWHNLVYGETGEEHWESQLRRFLGEHVTAYCTLPTCLTEEFRMRGFTPLLRRDPGLSVSDGYFNFWAALDPEDWTEPLLDALARYNTFLRAFAQRHDALLIDLHELMRPRRYEDAPNDFFDVCHLRPSAYPKLGRFVGEKLASRLPAASAADRRAAQRVGPRCDEDMRANIYPIW
jgi:hypothetical protein